MASLVAQAFQNVQLRKKFFHQIQVEKLKLLPITAPDHHQCHISIWIQKILQQVIPQHQRLTSSLEKQALDTPGACRYPHRNFCNLGEELQTLLMGFRECTKNNNNPYPIAADPFQRVQLYKIQDITGYLLTQKLKDTKFIQVKTQLENNQEKMFTIDDNQKSIDENTEKVFSLETINKK